MGERSDGDDPAVGPRAGGTVSQETDAGIDSDCVHAMLEDRRRRLVLDVVDELGVATRRDVATQVAAREREIPPHEVTEDHRTEVTISLYHIHVPKLVEVGVLEVENEMGRIRPGPKADPIMDLLEDLRAELAAENQRTPPDV